jgi:hypothetical protein
MQALIFCFFWIKPKEGAVPAVRKKENYFALRALAILTTSTVSKPIALRFPPARE